MYPTLLEVAGFPIHTYGVLIAIGFVLCVFVAKREAQRTGLQAEKIVDAGFWSLFVGMIGARLLYVITRWDYFRLVPLESFYVWEGGLVFYGGPLFVIPFFFWYARRHQIPIFKLMDIGAISLPLAHAFGRLGCLSTGCCYGRPTNSTWGIKLHSELVEPYLRGVNLHPTQLYESAALFCLTAILFVQHRKKSFDGQTASLYLIIYPVIRFIVETFRGDTVRGFVFGGALSTSQFISIWILFSGILSYVYFRSRSLKKAVA
ncbi:MAG TPA: prolipoprotein diacylglyceryl transferase [Oligoflexia bacterium]|nr:prolipoprotein diacylglyceryl transferase [Oligoflexia bacterium]